MRNIEKATSIQSSAIQVLLWAVSIEMNITIVANYHIISNL